MKILLLGGTVFLGRHLVDALHAAGHRVTLFNRGRHNADLFPRLEKLRGDRDGGLAALRGRTWDAVIDTCGYLPRVVRAGAELLADAVGHYTFVSSVSAYADPDAVGVTEQAPLARLADPAVETVNGETYGPLKALCEQAVGDLFAGRSLIVRPGLIVGPHDPTDRFTYWPHRVARGGEVLAPGRPGRRVQFLDARDLAAWIVQRVTAAKTGVFNTVGPGGQVTMRLVLEACQRVIGSEGRLLWVSDAFLEARGVRPYQELPLWIPGIDDRINGRRASRAGLRCREIEATIRDTLAWDIARPPGLARRAGLDPGREIELLRDWRAQAGRARGAS